MAIYIYQELHYVILYNLVSSFISSNLCQPTPRCNSSTSLQSTSLDKEASKTHQSFLLRCLTLQTTKRMANVPSNGDVPLQIVVRKRGFHQGCLFFPFNVKRVFLLCIFTAQQGNQRRVVGTVADHKLRFCHKLFLYADYWF